MESIIIDNISLMLLIPLWIFLIIMCGRFFSVYVNEKVTYILTLISSAFGIFTCSASLAHLSGSIDRIYPFIKIGAFNINCGIQVDKLSLILGLILFIISFAVQLFSIHNLKDEKKKYRFFALLNLFNFSMGALLFSPNLFQMYVFWELVGIVSYLLIGFDYTNPIKSEASKRVFILNRVGDTALITGIILVSYYMFSYAQNPMLATLSFEDMNVISTLTLAYAPSEIFIGICLLFIVAAAVKSAQFPFYSWLQDAMEAKIPVSALLHSATLVVLGGYLIIKLMPFFTLNSHVCYLILGIGIITALICSILASIETHPKKILAYSTSANLGLMFTALALGNIKLALVILISHAFIKSSLFLLIPEDKEMSYCSAFMLGVSSLSLSGLLFSGVGVKEILFAAVGVNKILLYLFLFICFVSAFYIIRFAILLMKESEYKKYFYIKDLPIIMLFVMNIGLYIFLRGTYNLSEPVAAAIGGIALCLLLFKHDRLSIISETPKLVEKWNNILIPFVFEKISYLSTQFENKVFSNYKPIIWLSSSIVKTFSWIEDNIMNETVNFTTEASKFLSESDKRLQSGNVQNYNAYGFILIALIITFVIVSYTFLIGQLE